MTTFAALLANAPDKVAIVNDSRRITYAQLARRVGQTAGRLRQLGVQPGDTVSSQLPNCIDATVVCLAANHVGAVHNPILATANAHEVASLRADCQSAIFVDRNDHEVLDGEAPAHAAPASEIPGAPRFLLYTSGSEAAPKGVLHSDGTLLAECAAQAAYHQLSADDVFVMPSPIAHVSGLLYGILLPLYLGATAVLMARWDPGDFLALVEVERGTFSGGATPFLQGAVDHPDLERFDVSSLAVFPCGGADVPPDLIRRATSRLGVRTGRGYGSTEFPSITSAAGPGEPDDRRATTDGRPIGANQVRIVDGEIEARGPELFLGYRDPALDAAAFTPDRWLRTGDLGVLDADGYLTVTGRRKDVVIRLGEKISAREVEQLLERHPAVQQVAVVALADPRTGERACACVVPTDLAHPPTLVDLTAHLAALGVSRRKHPEQVVVLSELPLTPSGKVAKSELRAAINRR
ncbi:MAG: AMP-binding protein [Actinomycetota bacterium]